VADSPPRLSRALLTLLPPVLGSMALSVAMLGLSRAIVAPDLLVPTNDVVGNYLQTIGTIYAVLLAFVVFVVWNQFTESRIRVEQEANELFDILRTSKGLPDGVAHQIREPVRRYVELVLSREWEGASRLDPGAFEQGWRVLDLMWDTIREYDPSSEPRIALYGELLARFNDLSDARTARISSALTRIPQLLRILLYVGAGSTIASICLFGVQRFALHALLIALLSGAVSHVLLVIEDLDRPFSGFWQVPRDPLERLVKYLDE
jgi:hypothetical protein